MTKELPIAGGAGISGKKASPPRPDRCALPQMSPLFPKNGGNDTASNDRMFNP
jgi:hypothetical protein